MELTLIYQLPTAKNKSLSLKIVIKKAICRKNTSLKYLHIYTNEESRNNK